MPIHDWSRVDANMFHHFHPRWTIAICNALNADLLPSGFSARVERHAGGLVPDVLAVQQRPRGSGSEEPHGDILTSDPPKTRLVRQAKTVLAARANRIVIRHHMDEVVCVLETVSSGNKSERLVLRQFIDKKLCFIIKEIHVLVIDILPPTLRGPQGMYKAVWDETHEEPFELPPDKPLTLAAYVIHDPQVDLETSAYVERVGVGAPLPDMLAYLDHEAYVPVSLETTYQAA